MAAFLYEFDWDPVKAKANYRKHGVNFEEAAQATKAEIYAYEVNR